MEISNSVALVTGGNRGIGLEVCWQLSEAGDRVVLGSRDAQQGQAATARLGHPEVHRIVETNLFGAWRTTGRLPLAANLGCG